MGISNSNISSANFYDELYPTEFILVYDILSIM